MKLSDLQRNERTIELEFAGEKIALTYRPGEVTPDFVDGLAAGAHPSVTALSRALVRWDLLGDDGASLPITERALMVVPTAFLRRVLWAILDDVNLGEAFGVTSKTG